MYVKEDIKEPHQYWLFLVCYEGKIVAENQIRRLFRTSKF